MFIDCRGLTRVDLPEGMQTIGAYAFQNCENLETVTVPTTVTYIAEGAFANCVKIANLTLPFIGSSRGSTGKAGLFGWIFGENKYFNLTNLVVDGEQVEITDNEIPGILPNTTRLRYFEENNIDETVYQNYAIGIVNNFLAKYNQEFVEEVTKPVVITSSTQFNDIKKDLYVLNRSYVVAAGAYDEAQDYYIYDSDTHKYSIVKDIDLTYYNAHIGELHTCTKTYSKVADNATWNSELEYYYKDIIPYFESGYVTDIHSSHLSNTSKYVYGLRTTDKDNKANKDYYVVIVTVTVVKTSDTIRTVTVSVNSKYFYTKPGYNEKSVAYYPKALDADRSVDGILVNNYANTDTIETQIMTYTLDNTFVMVSQNYIEDDQVKTAEFNVPATLDAIVITDETKVSYGAFMNASLHSIKLNDVTDFYDAGDGVREVTRNATDNTLFDEVVLTLGLVKGSKLSNARQLTEIGDYAFYNCKNLTTAIIPTQILKIGAYAFAECTNMSTAAIPYGHYANYNNIEYGTTDIGSYAFYKTAITTITTTLLFFTISSPSSSSFLGRVFT